MRAGIALGSNLGDRQYFLEAAVKELRGIHLSGDFLVSSFIETEPLDCPMGSPLFLNAVVELETDLPPLELFSTLQRIEVKHGRPIDHGFHEPRSLDLDILYYGDLVLKSPQLEIPHPRIRERWFVLKPLSEIRPELELHFWTNSCSYYLSQIDKKESYHAHP